MVLCFIMYVHMSQNPVLHGCCLDQRLLVRLVGLNNKRSKHRACKNLPKQVRGLQYSPSEKSESKDKSMERTGYKPILVPLSTSSATILASLTHPIDFFSSSKNHFLPPQIFLSYDIAINHFQLACWDCDVPSSGDFPPL